ncbi:hypothetical protein [Enterococcus faecium]
MYFILPTLYSLLCVMAHVLLYGIFLQKKYPETQYPDFDFYAVLLESF